MVTDAASHSAPCPTCDGERYDVTYRGAPAEDGGPNPCPTCNGSGTTERRPNPYPTRLSEHEERWWGHVNG